MRWKFILVAAAVAVLLAVAYTFLDRSPEPLSPVDRQAPNHYFIAENDPEAAAELCEFTLGLERETSHDMWNLRLQPCTLRDGWVIPGAGGVQAAARKARLDFFSERTDWTHLVVRARAMGPPTPGEAQSTRIRVNGKTIGEIVIPTTTENVALAIPPGHLRGGINTFTFSFAYRTGTNTSKKKKPSPKYAIILQDIALAKIPRTTHPGERKLRRIMSEASASRRKPATQIFDRDTNRFVVTTPGTLVMTESLAAAADDLEIELGERSRGDHPRAKVEVTLQSLGSGEIHSQKLTGWDAASDRGFRTQVGVNDFAGETCVISLTVEPAPDAPVVEIARPRITNGSNGTLDEPSAEVTAGEPSNRPDIVMITLDAARPHHLSSYGYHRQTTPNIDRLADESLVFRHAFALVPNTRRSVPTMVTGLSILNHQVTREDSTLSGEATTLAEYLGAAGYATAAFSSTPNNSRAIGTDQGYEVFVELWNELPRHKSRKPHNLAKKVTDWLAAQDDGRPLHLQIHFVPPHAPYEPPPKFDLWSDPGYDGPFDGFPDSIFLFDQRHRRPTDEDLAHAVALYDGNLCTVDDAVANVLDALKKRGRWANTVVLITADHGEAFYEHHRMSHNNTVYDEMLRVPFILRLPEGSHLDGFALDRLTTLADIVPTLLATASLEPTSRLDGVNLLRQPRHDHRPFDRHFVGQTAHPTPIRCIRTPRWKVILANSGQGELYDVVVDPAEQHNLRYSKPAVFVGLSQLLTRQLLVPPSITGGEKIEEVSENDRKMLEALGYVE